MCATSALQVAHARPDVVFIVAPIAAPVVVVVVVTFTLTGPRAVGRAKAQRRSGYDDDDDGRGRLDEGPQGDRQF